METRIEERFVLEVSRPIIGDESLVVKPVLLLLGKGGSIPLVKITIQLGSPSRWTARPPNAIKAQRGKSNMLR